MLYASLTGPLIGLYMPLPFEDEGENRAMLNTSLLARLWCSIYTSEQVDEHIVKYGGVKLPVEQADNL